MNCVQIYQQKVKHLLYEQQNNITTLKADTELALKLQQDEFVKREAELNRDKRALKQELREQVWLMAGPAAGGCSTECTPCYLWSAGSCEAHRTACWRSFISNWHVCSSSKRPLTFPLRTHQVLQVAPASSIATALA